MSDVSVVLLTMGEASTERALASVQRQTLSAAAVIEVRGVRPFHRALNTGAMQVTTAFFVQVDADMVLDPTCLEQLHLAIQGDPAIGVAVGFLRDPLVGRVSGIRLFRRACFDQVAFGDTISPDTDWLQAIAARGWRDVYALAYAGRGPDTLHTFGEHAPEYTFTYTWRKYVMEGARYRYRADLGGVRWHLGLLARSPHPMARVARLALLQGVTSDAEGDALGGAWTDGSADDLEQFLRTTAQASWLLPVVQLTALLGPRPGYVMGRAIGRVLRRRGAAPTLWRALSILSSSRRRHAWIPQAGLCRGIMASSGTSAAGEVARLLSALR
ncbi:MAG TPA: glycosyltransferase family A protein [Gemmatimonadaceae bacterium]|nr:glycosyltransferase family A protein [Gemmatimonadaceae bacterium]